MVNLIETACTYDCPDACALLVEHAQSGIKIKGNPDHPITKGFVCKRIRKHLQRLRSPRRLSMPLVRNGNGFSEVSWDEALDRVSAALASTLNRDPASVLHVMSGGSLGVRKLLVGHFFHSLGPVSTMAGGVCDETGVAAQSLDFGDCCGHDYTDLENSGAIVLWGRNPSTTGIHLLPFIKSARRRGARVVLIDVWKTPSSSYCDDFIQLAPGADAWLALGVLKQILDAGQVSQKYRHLAENFSDLSMLLNADGLSSEEFARHAGVEKQTLISLADLYTKEKPVATLMGWGMQRRGGGGHAIRAIDALCALSGNVGVAGAGANYNPGRLRGLDDGLLAKSTGPKIHVPFFARQLGGSDAVDFIYINGANPVPQFADSRGVQRALERVPFVVVADAFMTDTAKCADVVLPTTLMLEEERDAVGSYGHHHVAKVRKALDPPAGVLEDVEIVRRLRKKLGLDSDPLLDDPGKSVAHLTRPWFVNGEVFCRNPRQPLVPFETGFETDSGKMNLIDRLPEEAEPQKDFPLMLLSTKRREFQNSQIPEEEQEEILDCFVNPKASVLAGLKEGQVARLKSSTGSILVRVVFREDIHPEVCLVFQGGWLMKERAVNELVGQASCDLGMGTAFYDQRVTIGP